VIFSLWCLRNALSDLFKDYGTASQALVLILQDHERNDKPRTKALHEAKGHIVFKNVTFHYNKGSTLFSNKNPVMKKPLLPILS
jgi:ATP-binding cassette, subfamily B, bacterial